MTGEKLVSSIRIPKTLSHSELRRAGIALSFDESFHLGFDVGSDAEQKVRPTFQGNRIKGSESQPDWTVVCFLRCLQGLSDGSQTTSGFSLESEEIGRDGR